MDFGRLFIFPMCQSDLPGDPTRTTLRRRKRTDADANNNEKQKGGFTVTPKSSTSSFGSRQNGYYDNNIASSPRLSSTGDETFGEQKFKFLEGFSSEYPEVFTVSGTKNETNTDTMRSNKSHKSRTDNTLVRGSEFKVDSLRWNETDATDGGGKQTKSSSRNIIICVVAIILILAVLAAVAVILAIEVFKVGDKPEEKPSIRPELITLEGSLDLKATWTSALNDSTSALYNETAYNFTSEMDRLLGNSSLSESYNRTEVLDFRPGSINVRFRQFYNDKYKVHVDSPRELAARVENQIKTSSSRSRLPIDADTVSIGAVTSTTTSTTTATTTVERTTVQPTTSSPTSTVPTSPNVTQSSTTDTLTNATATTAVLNTTTASTTFTGSVSESPSTTSTSLTTSTLKPTTSTPETEKSTTVEPTTLTKETTMSSTSPQASTTLTTQTSVSPSTTKVPSSSSSASTTLTTRTSVSPSTTKVPSSSSSASTTLTTRTSPSPSTTTVLSSSSTLFTAITTTAAKTSTTSSKTTSIETSSASTSERTTTAASTTTEQVTSSPITPNTTTASTTKTTASTSMEVTTTTEEKGTYSPYLSVHSTSSFTTTYGYEKTKAVKATNQKQFSFNSLFAAFTRSTSSLAKLTIRTIKSLFNPTNVNNPETMSPFGTVISTPQSSSNGGSDEFIKLAHISQTVQDNRLDMPNQDIKTYSSNKIISTKSKRLTAKKEMIKSSINDKPEISKDVQDKVKMQLSPNEVDYPADEPALDQFELPFGDKIASYSEEQHTLLQSLQQVDKDRPILTDTSSSYHMSTTEDQHTNIANAVASSKKVELAPSESHLTSSSSLHSSQIYVPFSAVRPSVEVASENTFHQVRSRNTPFGNIYKNDLHTSYFQTQSAPTLSSLSNAVPKSTAWNSPVKTTHSFYSEKYKTETYKMIEKFKTSSYSAHSEPGHTYIPNHNIQASYYRADSNGQSEIADSVLGAKTYHTSQTDGHSQAFYDFFNVQNIAINEQILFDHGIKTTYTGTKYKLSTRNLDKLAPAKTLHTLPTKALTADHYTFEATRPLVTKLSDVPYGPLTDILPVGIAQTHSKIPDKVADSKQIISESMSLSSKSQRFPNILKTTSSTRSLGSNIRTLDTSPGNFITPIHTHLMTKPFSSIFHEVSPDGALTQNAPFEKPQLDVSTESSAMTKHLSVSSFAIQNSQYLTNTFAQSLSTTVDARISSLQPSNSSPTITDAYTSLAARRNKLSSSQYRTSHSFQHSNANSMSYVTDRSVNEPVFDGQYSLTRQPIQLHMQPSSEYKSTRQTVLDPMYTSICDSNSGTSIYVRNLPKKTVYEIPFSTAPSTISYSASGLTSTLHSQIKAIFSSSEGSSSTMAVTTAASVSQHHTSLSNAVTSQKTSSHAAVSRTLPTTPKQVTTRVLTRTNKRTTTPQVTTTEEKDYPPEANAGDNVTLTLPSNSVTLSGSSSDDHGIVKYEWRHISSELPVDIVGTTTMRLKISNLQVGVYSFELKVTDTSGQTDVDTVFVTVYPEPDDPPVADGGPDITINLPTNAVTLSGDGSTDDKGIVTYQWEKVTSDLPAEMIGQNKASVRVEKLIAGVYTFKLTVTDASGQTDHDTVVVTVEKEKCTTVEFEPCARRGFTRTVLPNLFYQSNMTEIVQTFNLAAQNVYNQLCQESALTYLCSLYFPQCDEVSGIQTFPCYSLCEEANNTCGDYFMNPYPCYYFEEKDCVALIRTTQAPTTTTTAPTCQATQLKLCYDIGFTETYFPNLFFEPDQLSATDSFESYFLDVINSGCSPDLLFFICSIQFPMCRNGRVEKPCKRTCTAVAEACPSIGPIFDCELYEDIDCIAPQQPRAGTLKSMVHIGKCNSTEFTCSRVTKCIPGNKRCDGVNDCTDWTDEMDCTCNETHFQCDMGMCIKSYQRCDGVAQCPDNSDEHRCDGCTHGQVKCPGSDKCIMSEWICDGIKECADGWDERNCSICGKGQYTCKNKQCVELSRRCDVVEDCTDGSDEYNCIKDENEKIVEMQFQEYWLPICASTWDDAYGDTLCQDMLGHGPFLSLEEHPLMVAAFVMLGGNTFETYLGHVDIAYECPGNKIVKLNCKPRGCGKRQVVNQVPFITGGEDAVKGAWPWHVALYFGGQYFCGGSLINENFVLTAAHCVEQYTADFSLMTVKLGAHHRKTDEVTQRVIGIEAVKSHPEHVYFEKNDIALLQLAKPIVYTDYIQPVCLPEEGEELPLYSTCYTIGWGKTKWDGNYAETLQQLKMTLWDTGKCNSSVAWNGDIYDTFLCAGYYSGVRSICKGDSGGPLICLDGQQTWKIIGISSYVANYCNQSAKPNIFTDVSKMLSWIKPKIECKFRCDNGRCLYNRDYVCDRIDHCGDNSDEMRECNRTVTCDFQDKYLCGYSFTGWKLGYDNKLAAQIEIDGQLHTESSAPQFDHTIGRYPGHFFYGKQKNVRDALLWSPRFNTTTPQTCVRFSYYLRGTIQLGMSVDVIEYYKSGANTFVTPWTVTNMAGVDAWRTGYFDITVGTFQLRFKTGELLKVAIDDIKTIEGMCHNVLCDSATEYKCLHSNNKRNHCIPKKSRCNIVIDCEEDVDEKECNAPEPYFCTFEDGNLCALQQKVNDASDWWLVNATFVRAEVSSRRNDFVDHTFRTPSGFLFYLNTYGLGANSNVYVSQKFQLNNRVFCFSFYYMLESDVAMNVAIQCDGCEAQIYRAEETFGDWTLFQLQLPVIDVVNISYDVVGIERSDSLHSYIALDDIAVKQGSCPIYDCPPGYSKCRTYDRCVPDSERCDKKVNCLRDESDEQGCVCGPNDFQCGAPGADGRCIEEKYKCDRVTHCADGTDEGATCFYLRDVTCTFEHPNMCGYEFISYSKYSWQRWKGSTPTPITGPTRDHTLGTPSGHFMYAEANEGAKGDNASLVTPEFNTGTNHSLQFYYHLFSQNPTWAMPGILRFSLENTQTAEMTLVWEADKFNLIDQWHLFCKNLPNGVTMRAHFTVVRDETTIYGIDMAIDDVQLNTMTCEEAAAPSTPTTTKPTTTTPTTTKPTTTKPTGIPSTTSDSACPANQRLCANGFTCVDKTFWCDGMDDCPDKSDEYECL